MKDGADRGGTPAYLGKLGPAKEEEKKISPKERAVYPRTTPRIRVREWGRGRDGLLGLSG